jgi:hypothetical protein
MPEPPCGRKGIAAGRLGKVFSGARFGGENLFAGYDNDIAIAGSPAQTGNLASRDWTALIPDKLDVCINARKPFLFFCHYEFSLV